MKSILSLSFLLGCTVAIGIGVAVAADHNDSPIVATDSRLDITDVFAFRSPNNPDHFVIIIGHFSPEVLGEDVPQFSPTGTYQIYIDTTNDYISDNTVTFHFTDTVDGGQTFEVSGVPGAGILSGTVTPPGDTPIVTSDGSSSAFAGTRDDPFYFDLDAFKNITKTPCVPSAGLRCPGTGAPVNFFSGRNIAALAIEFPVVALPEIRSSDSGVLHVWAKTFE